MDKQISAEDAITREAVAPAGTEKLTIWTSLAWAFGSAGPFILTNILASIILYYLIYEVKLEPSVAGMLVFAARMADVVLAPAIGLASDQTHSRWGRRRPYLLTAALLMTPAWLLMFNISPGDPLAGLWALLGLLMITLCYSLFNIPHIAMANDMTSEPGERMHLMSMKTIFIMAGGMLGGLAPLVLQYAPAGQGYFYLSLCLAFACTAPMLICFFGTHKTRAIAPTPKLKLGEMFQGLTQNGPFMAYAAGRLAAVIFAAGQTPVMLFFLQATMKLPLSSLAVFSTVAHVVALVVAPMGVIVARRFGKSMLRDLVIYVGLAFCLSFLFAGPEGAMVGLIVRAVAYGVVIGCWQLVSNAMAADVIDYDYQLTGKRREGLFAAFFSFADKTATAIGVLWVGVALSMIGFDKNLAPDQPQQPMVMNGLFVIMAILPAIGYVVAWISFKFYRLDPARGIYPTPRVKSA
ncbi:MAG: MFS transporter [Sphingobium sp.]